MAGAGRIEPHAELVQLRIQVRHDRAGCRTTYGLERTTIETILSKT